MGRRAGGEPLRPAVRRTRSAGPLRLVRSSDAGFTLIEVLVAVAIVTVVGAAVTPFVVHSLSILRVQGERQSATALASNAWEQVQATHYPANTAPTLPAVTTQTLDGIPYTVSWQLDTCVRDAAVSSACVAPPGPSGAVLYYRVIITVSWPDNGCRGARCTYQTSALLNTDYDPSFEVS